MRSMYILLLFILTSFSIYGQNKKAVTVTGQYCTTAALTANVTGGEAAALVWYKDSTPVVLRKRGGYNPQAELITSKADFGYYSFMCTDKYDNLYITESTYGLVLRFAPGDTVGTVVAGASKRLGFPHGIAVDTAGYMYIADGNKVLKWFPGDKSGVVVAKGLSYAYDVCLDKSGNLYVSDNSKNNVTKWKPGNLTGTVVAGSKTSGSQLNQLYGAEGICLDDSNNLYIADYFNDRVMKWKPNATQGEIVAGGNGGGLSINQCSPTDVFINKKDELLVSDIIGRIQTWASGADYGATSIGAHASDRNSGYTQYTSAFALNSKEEIFVYDSYRFTLKKYTPLPKDILDSTFGTYSYYDTGYYHAEAIFDSKTKASSNNFYINNDPFYVYIQGSNTNICGPGIFDFNAERDHRKDVSLFWTAPPGTTIISGQYTDSIRLKVPADFDTDTLKLAAANTCGTIQTETVLRIRPAKAPNIIGSTFIDTGSLRTYFLKNTENDVYYYWNVPEGVTLLKGQGTDTIRVKWGTKSGEIVVVPLNKCGKGKRNTLDVYVSTGNRSADKENSAIAENSSPGIQLYPQPAMHNVTLQTNVEQEGMYIIRITDVLGKVVYTANQKLVKGSNKLKLNIEKLNKGSYFVSVYGKYYNSRVKMIKQ